jgi:hypothetical protein
MRRALTPLLCAAALFAGCGDRFGCAGGGSSRPGAEEDAGTGDDVPAPPLPPPKAVPPAPPPPAPSGPPTFTETFDGDALEPKLWSVVRANDFKEASARILNVAPEGQPRDGRLALTTNTMGTDDKTVKHLGVRTTRSFNFRKGKRFAINIDWNNQKNPSYLTAAIYLCPTVTAGNPEEEPDWLKFEFVGVPRDAKTRSVIAHKTKGIRRWLDREGWPAVKQGREVGNHRIEILIDGASLLIYENGEPKLRLPEHPLEFNEAVVYLVMSSHSNYFSRTILFDSFEVSEVEVPR